MFRRFTSLADVFKYSITFSLFLVLLGACAAPETFAQEADPPEIANGERLFLETRFAQFFKIFLDNGGDINDPLPSGDPGLDRMENWKLSPDLLVQGPFAGRSINCRNCHMVDEQLDTPGYGMQTYNDFARRSPIPDRGDGKTSTVRISPPLINASLPRKHFLLHFDGEFPTLLDLVKGTLTGRNYGWLPGEKNQAIQHVASIVRQDNGSGNLVADFGNFSYTDLFEGNLPPDPEFLLPEA